MKGESTTVASASSGGMSAEIATTSGRGTITAETSFDAKSKTLYSISSSASCELAVVLGRGDAVADVLARVGDHPGRRGLHAQEAENGVRRLLEHPHDRVRDPREQSSGTASAIASTSALLERDRLRHELAEDDGEVRQDREGDQERDGRRERRLHQAREQRLADGTEEDRGDGDPDLHGRDEADRVVHQAERRARPAAAALGPLLEPAASSP